MMFRLWAALTLVVLACATPTTVSAGAATTPVAKVLVFVEENHSLSQMRTGMPYLYSQAVKYGYATHYTAAAHPSLPNYLAIGSGSTFAMTDDKPPSAHSIAAPSVFGAASAKSYEESMPSNCRLSDAYPYAVRHNPWAYVTAERARCATRDVPAGTASAGALHNDLAAGTLPAVGFVTPNVLHDAHDGTLATADAWLKAWLGRVYASPDWVAGRLAVVITADEDAHNQGNTVLTVVLAPSQHSHVVSIAMTHYSLSGYLAKIGHIACIRSACTAPVFATAFGLP